MEAHIEFLFDVIRSADDNHLAIGHDADRLRQLLGFLQVVGRQKKASVWSPD